MKRTVLLFLLITAIGRLRAQNDFNGIYLHASPDSSKYIRFTFLNQVWLRYAGYNPSTTIYGDAADKGVDIGLRRTRMQVVGNVYKNTFLYMQMGINNFSTIGSRKPGVFFHDATIEHTLVSNNLSMGAGLTGWSGLSRYSSPSAATILCVDAPLLAQTTNDASDQFLRKLGVFAKGQIAKLDYRFVAATPMAIQQSGENEPIGAVASFSQQVPNMQLGAYAKWDFFEKESNLTPYTVGSYLGKKKVLNVGGGFQYQKDAMWLLDAVGDTSRFALKNFAIDVFFDTPLNAHRKDALTVYVSHFWMNFGPNYIRNIGAMNPANGNSNPLIINGAGTAAPVLGTGRVYYSQLGYLLPTQWTGENIQLQVYGALTHANYDYLSAMMWLYDTGINLFKNGHNNKLTFNYQNRPVFESQLGQNVVSERKSMYIIQLQIAI